MRNLRLAPGPIKLAIEVVGPVKGMSSRSPPRYRPDRNLSGPPQFWMQMHSITYADKASVQVNNNPWVSIDDNSLNLLGLSKAYRRIGGRVQKMTVNLPPGALVAGGNTLRLRFNGPSAVGFRVLNFHFLQYDGSTLLPAETFVNDDPNTWQPPLTSAADIAHRHNLACRITYNYPPQRLPYPRWSGLEVFQLFQ